MSFRTQLIVTVLAGLLTTILVLVVSSHWLAQSAVRDLSGQILDQTAVRIEQQIHALLSRAVTQSEVIENLILSGQLDPADQGALTRYFTEAMKANPRLTYLSFCLDRDGNYCHAFRDIDGLILRRVRRVNEAHFEMADYRPGDSEPFRTKPEHHVDARQRPYYRAAVDAGRQTWTETYIFIGPQGKPDTPGVTCATPVYRNDALLGVVSADFDVVALGEYVRQLPIEVARHDGATDGTARGLAFIIENRHPREPEGTLRRVVIAHPDPQRLIAPVDPAEPDGAQDWIDAAALSDRRVTGLIERIASDETTVTDGVQSVRFEVDGMRYLGGYKSAASDRLDWTICMAIPEAQLMDGVWRMNRLSVLIGLLSLVAAVVTMVLMAGRISRPIEGLVSQTDRIRRGNLEPPPPIDSTVTEVKRLADAHERMRRALQSLMKLEEDLQLARRIQQSTLPDQLPKLQGYELDAWCEPAEQTGGDLYDVIALESSPTGPRIALEPERVDLAMLMLSDATGHGIGPALSVTQVRSMLRMAVRAGGDLESIAMHMNAQLCADLPSGRFITTWLGELDVRRHAIRGFSAGQGPLLLYRAARHDVDIIGADTFPLGITTDVEFEASESILLNRGDIFAVMSDGIFETFDDQGEQFGIDRVIEVIRQHHRASPARILDALRDALARFHGAVAQTDDRTAIVIRRAV
ncbi:MAG: hypothetical protein CMJ18_04060 [Phycisphaeraceae bacterium]|nr:hypothetical protein [Phycisphaeraceae bacterium]